MSNIQVGCIVKHSVLSNFPSLKLAIHNGKQREPGGITDTFLVKLYKHIFQ